MKILFLTNNEISQPLRQWLRELGEDVVDFQDRLTPEVISNVQPDFTISYNYRFIIRLPEIELLAGKLVNLHTSLLPWNRGAFPNAWSHLKQTPHGVTVHQIDEGLDTGPILVQQICEFDEANETLTSTYTKLHQSIQELFKANWESIRSQQLQASDQPIGGSTQTIADFEKIKSILEPEGWDIPISILQQRYADLCSKNAMSAG